MSVNNELERKTKILAADLHKWYGHKGRLHSEEVCHKEAVTILAKRNFTGHNQDVSLEVGTWTDIDAPGGPCLTINFPRSGVANEPIYETRSIFLDPDDVHTLIDSLNDALRGEFDSQANYARSLGLMKSNGFIEKLISRGALSPAARSMSAEDVLLQYAEVNALGNWTKVYTELARY